MRLLGAAAAAVTVAGMIVTGQPSAGADDHPSAGATGRSAAPWRSCGALKCTTVPVPVDWDAPSGASLSLGVAELPAVTQPARGTLFTDAVEPDGVGSSAIAFLQEHSGHLTGLLPKAHRTMDIVVIDRRGFGTSAPLTCATHAHDQSVHDLPATRSELDQLLAHDRKVARGCAASGALLHHLDTASTARDLDAVRRALGITRIRYFGETEGGSLGATYAARYPHRVAAMVLDGAADQEMPALPRMLSAARAGEDAFDHFAAWCHTVPSCLPGQDVAAEFDAAVRAADDGRLGTLTGAEIRLTTSHLLLGEKVDWAYLGAAIGGAQHGDSSLFTAFAIGPDAEYGEPGYTASRAAGCSDRPATPQDLTAMAAHRAQFPHLGGLSEWSDLAAACAGWPASTAVAPRPPRVTGAPPVLVVGTTTDSTTPYPWAVSLARHIAGSRLLTVHGTGHLGLDNSPCAAGFEDAYLADGTLPPRGATCPG